MKNFAVDFFALNILTKMNLRCTIKPTKNAQTSDEADTTALSDTTPTADPNQFSVEFYDYKTNELISKSNKNNLNEKLKASDDLIYDI